MIVLSKTKTKMIQVLCRTMTRIRMSYARQRPEYIGLMQDKDQNTVGLMQDKDQNTQVLCGTKTKIHRSYAGQRPEYIGLMQDKDQNTQVLCRTKTRTHRSYADKDQNTQVLCRTKTRIHRSYAGQRPEYYKSIAVGFDQVVHAVWNDVGQFLYSIFQNCEVLFANRILRYLCTTLHIKFK